MVHIIILLGEVWYNPARCNRIFRSLRLTGHHDSAYDFQKKYKQTQIVKNNHKKYLSDFICNIKDSKPIVIVYCGHGNSGVWSIGISKGDLYNITSKINNHITIVSDSCLSDSMDITDKRKNTLFISAARSSGKDEDTSAFFTFDGGYLSNIFYKEYEPNIKKEELKKGILKNYYKGNDGENHLPRFFSS
jgi:hypothetical protein